MAQTVAHDLRHIRFECRTSSCPNGLCIPASHPAAPLPAEEQPGESFVGESISHVPQSNLEDSVHPADPSPDSSPAPETGSPAFNQQEALERCFRNSDMLRQMIQCFFDEVKNLYPQMQAALQDGDLGQLARLGHRLKGTLLYLGAGPATAAALRVEQVEKHRDVPSAAADALHALDQECRRLETALTEFRLTSKEPG